MHKTTLKFLGCALTGALLSGSVLAHEAGDWIIRAGAHLVDPKSNNGKVAVGDAVLGIDVDDDTMFTFDITYMLTNNWGVELLAAAPFKHDISVGPLEDVGATKHLPPTLSVVYHFLPDSNFQPYVGVGLNTTVFFDEKLDGATLGDPGADLSLDTSYGAAAVVGIDFDMGNNWFFNFDVRYLDIDTDAKVKFTDGSKLDLGTVEIDPWAFGINFGKSF